MKSLRIYLVATLLVLFIFNVPQIMFRDLGYNTAVQLAQSFLDGRLDVDPPEEVEPLDLILHEERYYVPFPPAPALFLTPLVAVFGLDFNPLWITPLLGMLTAGVLFGLYRRLTQHDEISYLLSAAMIFGTAYWLCVRYAFDTYLAHMLTVLFVSIALWETLGKQRGWVIGLCLGIACSCRQLTVFVIPFVMAFLWFVPHTPAPWWARLKPIFTALCVLGFIFFALLWYNWARFGSPFETGYGWVIEDEWYAYRLERWGNFNWRYIPSNFLRMFIMGFSIEFQPPSYMTPAMSPWGTSLTFASPFIFYALWGRLTGPRMVTVTAWLSVTLVLLAVLMHKSAGGGWQINGMRYALDFLPLLSLLIATGMQRFDDAAGAKIRRAVVAYAILLNGVAIVITHTRHFFPS